MSSTEGKVIKCLAAVTWNVNEPFAIEEIQVAPPKAGEVRIKIVAAAICHTDVHALEGTVPEPRFPAVLGHESAGYVESVGPGVTSVKAGDKVIPVFAPQCYNCKFCKRPDTNLCVKAPFVWFRNMADGASRFSCKGQPLYHFMGTSSFSQYTVVEEEFVIKISEKAPLDKVCLLGCGISTGYGAALNTAKVKPGSTCAIWGLGSIGLSAAMGCKANGAARIIGVDINPQKKEMGKPFGVTEFLNPKDYDKPISEVIKEITGGGCDYTFEAVGGPATIREAYNACHVGWGKCTVLGVAPQGVGVELDIFNFLVGKTITGSLFGDWKSRSQIPALVEDYLNNKILLDEFISCVKPLAGINEGLELLRKGEILRVVIDFF